MPDFVNDPVSYIEEILDDMKAIAEIYGLDALIRFMLCNSYIQTAGVLEDLSDGDQKLNNYAAKVRTLADEVWGDDDWGDLKKTLDNYWKAKQGLPWLIEE